MATTIHYEYDPTLERLLLSNGFDRIIRNIISRVMRRARTHLSSRISSVLSNDPRRAHLAVRSLVYRRILGANLNILNRRGVATSRPYNLRRTLRPGQHGGNRIKPTARTIALNQYWGKDRGFILRFQNSGTSARTSRYGNRGALRPRNFFLSGAQAEMQQVMQELCTIIDQEYNKQTN